MNRYRPIAFLVTAVVGLGVLYYGGWIREEIGEVMFNAAML
jgi:hypothetical protein